MLRQQLLERRTALLQEIETCPIDNPTGFDTLRNELDGVEKRLAFIATREAMERAVPAADPVLTRTLRDYRLTRAIAHHLGLAVDAGLELEMDAEVRSRTGRDFKGIAVPSEVLEARTLTTTAPVGGPGGNLVATELMSSQYFAALTAQTVVARLGARTLNGLVGNVDIPGESDSPNAQWVAENAALTPSDGAFLQRPLRPKHVGSLTEISRNMVMQTTPAVEGILRSQMARDLGLAIDRAAIAGGGSNEPTGILTEAGVTSVPYVASIFDTLAEMVTELSLDNVGAGRQVLTNHYVERIALKAVDADGRPLGVPTIFHNIPTTFSNLVPQTNESPADNNLIMGDFAEMLIGVWSGLDVLVNPYEASAYAKGNIMLRAMATADVVLRHPQAFAKAELPGTADAIVIPA